MNLAGMKRGTHVFLIHKKNLIEISAKIKHLCEKQNSV